MLIHVIHFLRSSRICAEIVKDLSGKSDSELRELGIARSDIPRIAFERTMAA